MPNLADGDLPPRASQRRLGRDAAVSELIGTVLLLGVAVVLVAGFVLVLFAVPGPSGQAHSNVQAYILPTETDELVLEHRGGPGIPLSKLTASVTVNGVATLYVVGDNLGSGWSVVSAEGATKASADSFVLGDRAIFTSGTLQGAAVSAQLADAQVAALVVKDTPVQALDTTAPTFLNARVSGPKTIAANFTERLVGIDAAEFTVTGFTLASATLVGNGSAAEFVVSDSPAWTPDQTPALNYVGGGSIDTRDLANVAFALGSVTPVDRLAPGITVNPAASGVTTSAATITWTTNESGTSTVAYGPTPADLGLSASGASGTAHSVSLPLLTDSFAYYYAVTTSDAAGNAVTSATGTFTTAAVASGGGGGAADGAPPNHLTINLTANVNSGLVSGSTFHVALRNGNNVEQVVTSPLTIVLSTNSTNGYFLDSTGAAVVQTVTIGAGQSYAAFKYVDYKPAGYSSISATAFNTTPDAVIVQITGNSGMGTPYHLDFSSRAISVASGATTSSFTLTLKDQYDDAIPAPYALTIDLGTNSSLGYFTSGGVNVGSVTLSAGVATTAAITYTEHRALGPTLLTAVTNATTPATAVVTVTGSASTLAPGQRLVFSSVPQPLTAGVLSGDNFRVELHDEADRLVASAGTVTVRLQTNSTRGYFTSTGSATPIQSVNITGGPAFAEFRYVDARPGVAAITGYTNGTYPAIALVGIEGRSTAGEPDHLEFTATDATEAAGVASGTFTVALKNGWGETVPPPGGSLVVTLSTNSSLGFFVSNADGTTVINTVTIGASGTADLKYKDTHGGRHVLQAAALGVMPAVAGIDITGGVGLGGGSGDMLLGTAQTVTAAKTFNPGTLIVAGPGAGTGTLAYASSASSTTATLPANTGTIAELNFAQTWTAVQTYGAGMLSVNNLLSNGGGATLSLPQVTDTLLGRATTDTLTAAKTFNAGTLLVNGGGAGSVTLAYPNTASSFTATFPANTGTVAELNLAQSWTALQTFNSGATIGSGQALRLTPTATGSLPAAVQGALVYDSTTDSLKIGNGGSTYSAVFAPKYATSVSIDVGSTSNGGVGCATATITGAATTDKVLATINSADLDDIFVFHGARISAADTVEVCITSLKSSGPAANPAAMTVSVMGFA